MQAISQAGVAAGLWIVTTRRPLLNPPRLRHNPVVMKTTNAPLSYIETEIRSYLPTGWDLIGNPEGTWDPKKNVWRAQVIDGFAWVDMKTDTQTVARVTGFLSNKPYTALREIAVVGQQALVITSLRKDPTANPGNDKFMAFGVSLRDGSVEELLDGTNLKYIDWQKFYDYDTPELLATYDDCAQCKATTFLTAFYLDRRTRHWDARWRRDRERRRQRAGRTLRGFAWGGGAPASWPRFCARRRRSSLASATPPCAWRTWLGPPR